MKKLFALNLLTIIFLSLNIQAQEFAGKLNEAQASYNSGDLENARFTLEQSLQIINQEIGKEILSYLPDNLGGLPKSDADDNVTGISAGFAGLFVHRNYKAETKEISVEIMSDSPMMAGINALLSLPVFFSSDPNQKRIKIKNYKALLTKSVSEENIISYTVNMPFGSSMLVVKTNGISDEKEVSSICSSLPVDKIVSIAQ